MKKMLIIISLIFFTNVLFAQNKVEEKRDTLWTPKGIVGINLSQVSFSNWSQGGQNSLAFTLFSNLGLNYIGDPWKWKNSLKITFGRTKVGNDSYRTNDNEIFFESTLIEHLGWSVSPYVGVTARTAITKGFNYEMDPAVQIVDIFDPLYLTEAVGFTYDQIPNFSTRLGVGLKQTIANDFAMFYSDDPDTPDEIEKFKNETGIESVTEYKWMFLENMEYQTYLRLFGIFKDLGIWDVRWDNTITAKINDYFNVNFNVLLVYDKDESAKRQLKEALQLGFSYTLF